MNTLLSLLVLLLSKAYGDYAFVPRWGGGDVALETLGEMPVGIGSEYQWTQVRGAINDIAFVPDSNEAYAAAVNTGLVYTQDFTAELPVWERVPNMPSAISSVAINPRTHGIVVATGAVSSFRRVHSVLYGMYVGFAQGQTLPDFYHVPDSRGIKFINVAITETNALGCATDGLYVYALAGGSGGKLEKVWDGTCFDLIVTSQPGQAPNSAVFAVFADGIFRSMDDFATDDYDWFGIPKDMLPDISRDLVFKKASTKVQVIEDATIFYVMFNSQNGPGVFFYTEFPFANPADFLAKGAFTDAFLNLLSKPYAVLIGQGEIHLGFEVHPTDRYKVYIAGTYYPDTLTAGVAFGDVRATEHWKPLYNHKVYGSLHPDVRKLTWFRDQLVVCTDGNLYMNPHALDGIPGNSLYLSKAGTMRTWESQSFSIDPESGYSCACFQDAGCAKFLKDGTAYGPEEVIGDMLGDGGGCVVLRATPDAELSFFSSAQMLHGLHEYYADSTTANFENLRSNLTGHFVTYWMRDEEGRVAFATAAKGLVMLSPQNGNFMLDEVDLSAELTTTLTWKSVFGHPSAPATAWFTDRTTIWSMDLSAGLGSYQTMEVAMTSPIQVELFCIDPMTTYRMFVVSGINSYYLQDSSVKYTQCPSVFGLNCLKINACSWFRISEVDTALVIGTSAGVFVTYPERQLPDHFTWMQLKFGIEDDWARVVEDVQFHQGMLSFAMMGAGAYSLSNPKEAIQALVDFVIQSSTMETVTFSHPIAVKDGAMFFLKFLSSNEIIDITDRASIEGNALSFDLSGLQIGNEFYAIATETGNILMRDNPTVYCAVSVPTENEFPKDNVFGNSDNMLIIAQDASAGSGTVPAGVPTDLILSVDPEKPSEIIASWTPGDMGDCDFSYWLFKLKRAGANTPAIPFLTNDSLFNYDAHKSVRITSVSYQFEYQFTVQQICIVGTARQSLNSPESAESSEARPRSPRVRTPHIEVDRPEITATQIGFKWKVYSTYGCEFVAWELEMKSPFGVYYKPVGCMNMVDEQTSSCVAKNLTSDTIYMGVRLRYACTDPLLTSEWGFINPDWNSGTVMPKTLKAECGGLCPDGCIDGLCVCPDPAGTCCEALLPPQKCQIEKLTDCVCSFDPYCCEHEWDYQCVKESEQRCDNSCPLQMIL